MRLKTPKELVFADLRKHLKEGKIIFKPLHESLPMIIHLDMAKIEERVLAEAMKPIKVAMIAHDSSSGRQAVLAAALAACDHLLVVDDTPHAMEIKALDVPPLDVEALDEFCRKGRDKQVFVGIDLAKGKYFSVKATYQNGRITAIRQTRRKNFGRRGKR